MRRTTLVVPAALAAILSALLPCATGYAQNIAGNPGFENGPASPSPWSLSGIAHISDGANSHAGLFEAQFSGDDSSLGDVAQPIPTVIGDQYLVTFWATSDGYGSNAGFGNFLDASFGSGSDDLSDGQLGALNGSSRAPYQQFSFSAKATSTSTTLDFSGQDFWGNIWLDDVSVTDLGVIATPEPGSALLALLAIGVCILVRVSFRHNEARPASWMRCCRPQ